MPQKGKLKKIPVPTSEVSASLMRMAAHAFFRAFQGALSEDTEGVLGSLETLYRHLFQAKGRSWAQVEAQRRREFPFRPVLKMLEPLLVRLASESAQKIVSLSEDARQYASVMAREAWASGARPQVLERIWQQQFTHYSRAHLKMLARTEMMKAAAEFTQAKAMSLGLEWYLWSTSQDQRVRASHKNLNRVLIRYTDPPQPEQLMGMKTTLGKGNAGEFPNCRCTQIVLVRPEDIGWPRRVYHDGKIERMTMHQWKIRFAFGSYQGYNGG
jgi:SPP1 gp7 family putative phage head morphogenesis protein